MGLILSQATLEERITSVDSKLERTTARVESLEKGWAKTASLEDFESLKTALVVGTSFRSAAAEAAARAL